MKTESELSAYKNTKSDFTDYTYFEDVATRRFAEREAFINDQKYTPEYRYPRFNSMIDPQIENKKRKIYEAILELDASKEYSGANIAETELFARSIEVRLKKILLVEAARNLGNNSIINSSTDVNRESFAKLNESLYGSINTSYYLGMINTEKNRLSSFSPQSAIAKGIKSKLELLIGHIDTDNEHEELLISGSSMAKLHDFVNKRYADVLNVVPNTPDDVYYDVTECAEIMNRALNAGKLDQYGWKVKKNSKKSKVATSRSKNTIYLPSDTRRTASELRYLIIHEQEVHVRRTQNGRNSGFDPLVQGTADYADAEEGLAVLLGLAANGTVDNKSLQKTRNNYITAGLALGIDCKPRDAREVYEILWRTISIQEAGDNGDITDDITKIAKEKAYYCVENAYRGTQFWMKGVIYTKLKVYYEGIAKNAEYFNHNIDTLDSAFDDVFIGKYNHTDPVERNLVKSIIKR